MRRGGFPIVFIRLDFRAPSAFERFAIVLPLPKDGLVFVKSAWLVCPSGNTFSRLDFVPLGDYWATEIDSITEQLLAAENGSVHGVPGVDSLCKVKRPPELPCNTLFSVLDCWGQELGCTNVSIAKVAYDRTGLPGIACVCLASVAF